MADDLATAAAPAPAAAAVVLSGGRSSRMGGPVPKPLLSVGGTPLLHRVLAALTGVPTVVVGVAPDPLPDGVRVVAEDPPGAGPAYALACGIGAVPEQARHVYVLAADLPLLTAPALAPLTEALTGPGTSAGAVYADRSGREQWLCGCWRTAELRRALRDVRPGASLRSVLAPLRPERIAWTSPGPPPFLDCDTPRSLAEAERALDLK